LRTSCLYLPPPSSSSSIFSFLSHPYNPPSSILSLPLSPIPYTPIPYTSILPSSIFNLYPLFPLLTPHSSLLLLLLLPPPPLFTSSSPPFLPPLFRFFFLTHTHTHNLRYAISLQSFFFIKEYGTFSIVCPATWFIKKVGMGLKGV